MDSQQCDPSGEAPRSDAGFGLIEIVVAMFLLALIAVAFLPLLIQGIKTSVSNSTLATATQLVHDQLEAARALDTCDALSALAGIDPAPAHPDFQVERTIGDPPIDPCPATYPGTVKVTVSVADLGDPATPLAEATTLILVVAEN